TSIMTVSVPGKNSAGVVKLVSQTAELLFRQVLLMAPNAASAVTQPPAPSPTPSGGAASPSENASPQPSSSATTRAKGRGGGENGTAVLARSASRLGTVTAAQAKASPTPTPSAASSGSATPAATPSPTPTVTSPNHTSTWQQASGNAAALSPQIKNLFDQVNCASKNWAQQIGYGPAVWGNPKNRTAASGRTNGTSGVPYKFVLDQAKVLGSQIKSASATPQQSSTFWQTNINFNGAGAKAFGDLTTQMYAQYGKSASPLDDLAVVLDGQVI